MRSRKVYSNWQTGGAHANLGLIPESSDSSAFGTLPQRAYLGISELVGNWSIETKTAPSGPIGQARATRIGFGRSLSERLQNEFLGVRNCRTCQSITPRERFREPGEPSRCIELSNTPRANSVSEGTYSHDDVVRGVSQSRRSYGTGQRSCDSPAHGSCCATGGPFHRRVTATG